MKKLAILYSDYNPTIDAIKYQLRNCIIDCYSELSEKNFLSEYSLVVLCNFKGDFSGNALNIHYSLLPAFASKEPVKEAALAGVKVTGLTVYYTQSKKIIAQYPIFIRNDMHYDDIKQELQYIEQIFYPRVIEKVLNNEPFESQSLMKKDSSCTGSCKECGKCSN